MRKLLLLMALLPFTALAQPLDNPTNNPNLPGYQNPSQQRMQTQMQSQQIQQKGMLNQQLKNQTQVQQQHLESQINNNTRRIQQGELNPRSQQLLPNNQGGMLSRGNVGSVGAIGGGEQHMIPPKTNGDMLRK
ncbi:DUF2756 family protein [Siccibacter turicensis]|uniref:DUF2756 domain-containing protein n=1 Tax=Siccibacter turicensis TaxID=357233 RepID=A0A2P8VHX5_9ENTR|nr:DUF2756 family protein [Siccibacter turicensis]MDY0972083.1 DUF2756 family protein [Siccibacter turicensis]PSN07127.1 hypothetical protein C7G83_12755 [Siccibacter turicensis]